LHLRSLPPDWIKLPPETIATALRQRRESTPTPSRLAPGASTRTPTANFFSVTRFELMHIRTVETRQRPMKSRQEIIAIIVVLFLCATMYGWYRTGMLAIAPV